MVFLNLQKAVLCSGFVRTRSNGVDSFAVKYGVSYSR